MESTIKVELLKRSSSKGKDYVALCVDVGYRVIPLAFDNATISEILGVQIGDVVEAKARLLTNN